MNEQIQTAYNSGLNDAEDMAIDKFRTAFAGWDNGPFANPKMEELRQDIFGLRAEMEKKAEAEPEDTNPKVTVKTLELSTVKSFLMGTPEIPTEAYDPDQARVMAALKNTMDFIYLKAKPANHGARNYTKLVNDIKETLTSGEVVVN